jgi:hypothetical protein
VRHQVSGEVESQAERQGAEPRADERAARCAGCDVERDDQAATLARGRLAGVPYPLQAAGTVSPPGPVVLATALPT